MKKGFTLVELIIIIAIIGVFMILLIPNFNSILSSNKEKSYDIQISHIETSAYNFILENYDLFINSDDYKNFSIELKLLKDLGFIDFDLKNPLTGKMFSDNTIIRCIRNEKGNYDFLVIDKDGDVADSIKYENYIVLLKNTDVADNSDVTILNINGTKANINYSVSISSDKITSVNDVNYKMRTYTITGDVNLSITNYLD